jgi:hypothetical protein
MSVNFRGLDCKVFKMGIDLIVIINGSGKFYFA